jgi:acetyl-CoA C-acetyltransferase
LLRRSSKDEAQQLLKVKQEKMPTTPPLPEDRIPVIVGVGEIADRPKDIAAGPRAARAAGAGAEARGGEDSGGKLLGEIGSLDVVNFLSWRYRDPEKLLAEAARHQAGALLLRPGRRREPDPLSARSRASASRAANAASPRSAAPRRNRPRPRPSAPASTLPWTPFAHDVEEPKRGAAFQKPMAVTLGVFRPITVYPLYEAATSAHWGQTPREALAESGELWSTYAGVASENPNSWLKRALRRTRSRRRRRTTG